MTIILVLVVAFPDLDLLRDMIYISISLSVRLRYTTVPFHPQQADQT